MAELNEYEQQVVDWLNTDPSERNLDKGATLMLQGNRNRILHKNVLAKSNFDKIEYELRKIVGSNPSTPTIENIEEIEKRVETAAVKLEGKTGALRPDHDQLPEYIRKIPEVNTAIYHEMRSIHEKLKIFSGENYSAADRLPFLTKYLKFVEELAAAWEMYDSFDLSNPPAEKKVVKPVVLDAKTVSNHRKFLSLNKGNLKKYIASGNIASADKTRAEMQRRFDECTAGGVTFDPKQLEELATLGLNVG